MNAKSILIATFCLSASYFQWSIAQGTVLSSNRLTISARTFSAKITESGLLNEYATLERAFRRTQLDEKLTRVASYTLFAPSDQAFFNLPADVFNRLLTSGDSRELENTLRYHIIPGSWDSIDIIKALCNDKGVAVVNTLHGDALTIQVEGIRVFLIDSQGNRVEFMQDYSTVSEKDGIVVHRISRVMTPPVYE